MLQKNEFILKLLELKNALSTFQRFIDNIQIGIPNDRCLVFVDNIIIHSPSIHECVIHLIDVF